MTIINEIKKSVSKIEKNNHFQYLSNLAFRWEDEKEYEEWNDYVDAIKKQIDYIDIIKVTKRPFGFKFKVKNCIVTVALMKKGNSLNLKITYK